MSCAIFLFFVIICFGTKKGTFAGNLDVIEIDFSGWNTPSIVRGVEAMLMEFPHMVALGFDVDNETISWDCGGALISNEWVLTAAHCTWKADAGDVSKVRFGDIDLGAPLMASSLSSVERIVIHPEYVGNKVYNDIALLKLKKKVLFSMSKSPICLHQETAFVKYDDVTAMGFGLTEPGSVDSKSEKLMKVKLELFTYEECSRFFGKNRKFPDGLNNATQVCFGSRNDGKDTCQGDSGSPVVVRNPKRDNCPYSHTLIALTSFGTSCGIIGQPAVYTRIAAFAPWIRSIEPNAKV